MDSTGAKVLEVQIMGTPKVRLFISNCFALLLALSVAQQPIRGQLKAFTIQDRTLGFQDLHFLNFVSCMFSYNF